MAHNHHSHVSGSHKMGKQLMTGTIAAATVNTGGKLMVKLVKHPFLVFGFGVAAGILVYRYRKEIITNATKTYDAGKDFVLQQKESLEDIVAETKETS
jgi:hypothetical protein